MKISDPILREMLELRKKLADDKLTEPDLQRITELSRFMNKLNPKFEVFEFVRDDELWKIK
jgi:hypothetical protein